MLIGLPAGLQSTVFSLSNVGIQSSINSFGSMVVAGNSASSKDVYKRQDEDGAPCYRLSRAEAQRLCKAEYLGARQWRAQILPPAVCG